MRSMWENLVQTVNLLTKGVRGSFIAKRNYYNLRDIKMKVEANLKKIALK